MDSGSDRHWDLDLVEEGLHSWRSWRSFGRGREEEVEEEEEEEEEEEDEEEVQWPENWGSSRPRNWADKSSSPIHGRWMGNSLERAPRKRDAAAAWLDMML